MAKRGPGQPKKYRTARALRTAVDAYFTAISYTEPVMVTTPTGEVDERGRPVWATRMLTDKPDGTGRPVCVTRYMTKPSMAALYLHLGISKETWSNYGSDDKLKGVVEETRNRMEAYWVDCLDGKGAQGAKFALSCCYGWREKVDITGDNRVTVSLGAGEELGA